MYPTDVTWTQEMPSKWKNIFHSCFCNSPGKTMIMIRLWGFLCSWSFHCFCMSCEKKKCLTSLLCWNNLYNISSWASISKVQPVFKLCWNNSATLEPSINSISSVADLHRPSCYPLTKRASFRPRVVLRRKAVLHATKLKISRNFILKTGGMQWTAWDSNK